MGMMAGDIIDLTQDDDQAKPNKRPRLLDPPEPKQTDKERLLLVLKTQVTPHLHRALQDLPSGCKKWELGAAIIRNICDAEFERAFNQGGGALSLQVERQVADRVRRLVVEMSKDPAYRPANTAPAHLPPPSTDHEPSANTSASAYPVPPSTYHEPSANTTGYASSTAQHHDPVPKPMPTQKPLPLHGAQRPYMHPGYRETPVPPPVLSAAPFSRYSTNSILPSIESNNSIPNPERPRPAQSQSPDGCIQNIDTPSPPGINDMNDLNVLDDGNDNEYEGEEAGQNSMQDMDISWTDYEGNDQGSMLDSGSPGPSPALTKKKGPTTTPQKFRALRKARHWQQQKTVQSKAQQSPTTTANKWFGLFDRPYLGADERRHIVRGIENIRPLRVARYPLPRKLHVDFTAGEIQYLRYLARSIYGKKAKGSRDPDRDLRHLLKKDIAQKGQLRNAIVEAAANGYCDFNPPPSSLRTRTVRDLTKFLTDLLNRDNNTRPKHFSLETYDRDIQPRNPINSLLSLREAFGNRPPAMTRGGRDTKCAFTINREDQLEPKAEWTNCSGDIMTISWVSDTHFVCGAVTHSDAHNQQYNKAGNLLLGSVSTKSVKAYPHHRIIRPLVAHGENSLESMRESQSPWLYTSVVSSDYQAVNNLAFTSSFDHTVKIWKLINDDMVPYGSWLHGGRVNFVVSSHDPDGMVATAADVPNNAVRVYHPNSSINISTAHFDAYPCMRVHDPDFVPSEKWAYYPSAIRWGLGPDVRHLLLVGYSPRTLTGDERDIPEERLRTGELCLWDTKHEAPVKINNAASSNVFEVVWHPSLPIFAAATSASGLDIDQGVKTQVRLFQYSKDNGSYTAFKTLDCFAADINELSLRSNSYLHSFIAAGCTDGRVYVWDSGLPGDRPFCMLQHGDPIEEVLGEREIEDVGVKFVAWAHTSDRLYTGSSDGILKVWNIKHRGAELVKELVEVGGPLTAGAFSPDLSRLVVGDGAGRITLLALEDDQDGCLEKSTASISGGLLNPSDFLMVPQADGKHGIIRRPRSIIPHADPDPPEPQPINNSPNIELAIPNQNITEGPWTDSLVTDSEGLPRLLTEDVIMATTQGQAKVKTLMIREKETMDDQRLLSPTSSTHQRNIHLPKRIFPRQPDLHLGIQDRELHSRNQERDLRLTEPVKLQLQGDRAEHPGLNEIDYDLEYEDEDVYYNTKELEGVI